jgi:hypothetical protein
VDAVGRGEGSSWMLRNARPRSTPPLRASATVTSMRRLRMGIARMASRKAFRLTRDICYSASHAMSGRVLNRFECGGME